jgi:hypothetical protein
MMDPAYESMLEEYRSAWESGQFDRLIPAFMLCSGAGLPLPQWLSDAVLDDLQFAYRTRKRGDQYARTGAVQDHWNRVHQLRHGMMRTALEQQAWAIEIGLRTKPQNMDEAAKEVERALSNAGSYARGSFLAIQESYNRLENGEN